MDRVICLVQCAWGVVEHVSRIFFGQPLLITPSGWGLVLNLVIFGFLPVTGAHCLWVLVFGLFLVGYWAFHGLFLSETFFVESLILAQDERWRRA